MGLNVRIAPENPHYPATSLLAAGAHDPQPEVVLDRLLAALGYWTALYERDGFAPIRAAWLKLARQGPMRARLPKEEILGEFSDLDEQGRLCLRLPDGNIRKINAGDIFF
jgi:BirA family biotin operon repressor/biotin-[acetyl-CoA-carboxylase] ligase